MPSEPMPKAPRHSLAEDLFVRAAAQPDHPAILGPREDQQLSYADLAGRVRRLAAALERAGLRPGTNVGLHYPSGVDYIVYTYALWACGACVTPIPTELAGAEKRLIFRRIAIHAAVTTARDREELVSGAANGATPLPHQALYLPGTRRRQPPPGLASIHPAFIRFTSGTTREAKGVVLSHASIRERVAAANAVLHIGPRDRIVWLLSMAYHFAVSIAAYLSLGATLVLPANAFGAGILEAAAAHRATLICGAPTHYELMTHDRSGLDLPPLRLAIVTTARLRPELGERCQERFGRALNETYGIIEVGLPAINVEPSPRRPGSVGPVLPAYAVRLATAGDEAGASVGTPGEVLLRGPGLLDAYYDPWQPRQAILAAHGGWLATGDVGVLDGAGHLTLVGRRKELISVRGMKLFPQEVEGVLERCPGVAEACVYAAPDRRLGEVPHADLVPVPGALPPDAAQLEAHCAQLLAAYKVPRRFRCVERLPRTASGKLLRRREPSAEPESP
jgi:long-chain acyl-CoA synthetase